MFLHNCWYVAGWSHDFSSERPVARTMLGEPIVLYRKADGGIAALAGSLLSPARAAVEGAYRG